MGHTPGSYMQEKIWSKGGFEEDATWWIDNDANAMEVVL